MTSTMEHIRDVATHIHLELGNWGRNRNRISLVCHLAGYAECFFPLKFREQNLCGSSSMYQQGG